MSRLFLLISTLMFLLNACSPTDADVPLLSVKNLVGNEPVSAIVTILDSIGRISNAKTRDSAVDSLLSKLATLDQIPYKHQTEVLFLYRGSAHNVHFNGAFNGWGRGSSLSGKRIGKTDVWIASLSLNSAARLEYKITLNTTNWFTRWLGWQTQWIFDPLNPHQRMGGFGPDSELRMPDYKTPSETIENQNIPKGSLEQTRIIFSKNLGYEVAYRVYLPAGFSPAKTYPVVYVTDGHEYADSNLGRMPIVLDNAIAAGKTVACLAVFVDPRDPQSGENRRMDEFALNERFADFLALELVPAIDSTYPTQAAAQSRALMGTSLGGLNAAFVGQRHSGTFGNLAIHSPAFWFRPAIFDFFRSKERLPLKIYMATGFYYDAEEHARMMRDLLREKDYPLEYSEHPESHSWGLWAGLIDDPLHFFWPANGN